MSALVALVWGVGSGFVLAWCVDETITWVYNLLVARGSIKEDEETGDDDPPAAGGSS